MCDAPIRAQYTRISGTGIGSESSSGGCLHPPFLFDTIRLKTDLDILLRRFGRLAWRYGLLVAINNLRPFAFCRKARCKHQLSNGFDRRRIGTRETGDVTL